MRLLPRSLIGQTMLVVAAALLIAQIVSAVLLFRSAEQRREAALVHAAAFQLAAGAHQAELRPGQHSPRVGPMHRALHPRAVNRPFRYHLSAHSPQNPGEPRHRAREAALAALLTEQGIPVEAVVVLSRDPFEDPLAERLSRGWPRARARLHEEPVRIMVAALKRRDSSQWEVTRVFDPRRDPRMIGGLVLQTAVLFVILLALLYFALRRISRPLARLTERTERFAGNPSAASSPLEPQGPQDMRRLIAAHNAMEARIGSMLDEKDVMLGAIGHDLKTPLAALRVRIESVGDEAARTRMAQGVEEIARTLDEILALARIGRSDVPVERTDIAALAASVVEEFEDIGGAAALGDCARLVAPVRITWLKRGLRNLVANALRYGGSANVTLHQERGEVVLGVEDNGPGIPEHRIAEMLEPFTRGEASRNRATGGAGLGLALTRAVAELHGGRLVLANRAGGGLRAEIRLPA